MVILFGGNVPRIGRRVKYGGKRGLVLFHPLGTTECLQSSVVVVTALFELFVLPVVIAVLMLVLDVDEKNEEEM